MKLICEEMIMQTRFTRCCFALGVIVLLAIAHPVDARFADKKENTVQTVFGMCN